MVTFENWDIIPEEEFLEIFSKKIVFRKKTSEEAMKIGVLDEWSEIVQLVTLFILFYHK